MKYLDHLPHTPYHDLPVDARAEIDQATYEQLAQVTGALRAEPLLPPALGTALTTAVANKTIASPVEPALATWRNVAVAGWLSALALGAWLLVHPTRQPDLAPPLPVATPLPVVVRDTVTVVRRDTVARVQVLERVRTVHDTVYVPVSPRRAPVLRAATPAPRQPAVASRSVSEGPDWSSLTVSGDELF